MKTPQYTLYIGSKNLSSWSLRGWLIMKKSGLPFTEKLIELNQPQTQKHISAVSPSGRVPVLYDHKNDLTIHDSLAIGEYIHEICPNAQLWPADRKQRALARSIVAEMHSSFAALRQQLSMHCWDADKTWLTKANADCHADIQRILEIWKTARQQSTSAGNYLFGSYSLADIFYAPVVIRFKTYGVDMPQYAHNYCLTIWNMVEIQEWLADAKGA